MNDKNRQIASRRPGGFTLVELLVVIGIIALLVAIAVPTAVAVRNQAKTAASLILVRTIAGGVELYHKDFNEQYPPAEIEDMNSAETICFYMIGYADDFAREENPDQMGQALSEGRRFYEDDGYTGFGWRRPDRHRGKRYGPYNGLEEKAKVDNSGGPGEWVFVDSFDRTVWYGVFEAGQIRTGDIPDLNNEQDYFKDRNDNYYTRDFVLLTSGQDGEYRDFASHPETDDVTNFLPE